MKYLQFILTVFLLGFYVNGSAQSPSQANAIDKYFQQYVEDERFTVIYISSKLIKLFKQLDIEELELDDKEAEAILDIAEDLQGLRVLITEETPDKFFREAKDKIDTREYEILMTVRSHDGDNVEFLTLEENDIIKELLLLVSGDEEFILMSFVGTLDLDKISKLGRAMEKK